MRGFLLVAHGSRQQHANEEIIVLTERINSLVNDLFDIVGCAFLERAIPNVHEKINEYIEKGVREIIIFPYLLAAGSHVSLDIPALAAEASEKDSEAIVKISPHLGALPGIAELIVKNII